MRAGAGTAGARGGAGIRAEAAVDARGTAGDAGALGLPGTRVEAGPWTTVPFPALATGCVPPACVPPARSSFVFSAVVELGEAFPLLT